MTDVLSRSLPAPKDWQAFERLTFDVFRRLWKSSDTELHGRAGQSQSGVDVFGTDFSSGVGSFTGVQCKGKDSEYGGAVTEKELRAEVDKALNFQPPLHVFILATTGPNDAAIQAVARAITVDHRKSGKFEVQVKGWDTLRQFITDFPDVVNKHFLDFAPVDLIEKIEQGRAEGAFGIQHVLTVLHRQERIMSGIRDSGGEIDPLAETAMEIANQIGDGSPRIALKALERMLKEHEANASKLALFRILANIGNAHLALGDQANAIALFLRAYEAYPEYTNARVTLAVVKTLQGDHAEALDLAKSALRDDPTVRRAAGVIIDVMPRGTPIAEVQAALTPEVLGHFEVKIGLSIRSQREGDNANALRLAEEARRLKPDDWRTLSAVAEALLSPIATLDTLAVTGIRDEQLQAKLDRAVELNRQAWNILAAQDSSFLGRHVAANLVAQLLLAGEEIEAWQILDQAIAKNPDYAPLLQRQAQRAAGNGNWESAMQSVAAIPGDQRIFEDEMLIVQCALRLKDAVRASAAIPELTRLVRLPEQAEFAAALSVQAEILGGVSSTEAIEAMLEAHPKSIIVRSIILDFVDSDGPLKARIVDEVTALSASTISVRERVLAAEAMIDGCEFSKAADLYEPLHNQKDSPALFRRLLALHRAERRKEARQLYESLPTATRQKDRYVTLGIGIYEQAGLLKPAVKLLENVMASSDRLTDRLRWMQFLIRLGETRFLEWLKNVSAEIDGTARELTMLAQFVDKYLAGDAKALELGYRALRAGYSDPQVHLGYAFGLFFQGSARRGEIARPAKVEPGSGVILANEVDGEVLHYIIEPREKPAAERGELAPGHVVAKELLGHAAGDTITIRKAGTGHETYRIMEVQNGYVFAFQRTLRDFNRMFPGHTALGSITIDDSKEPAERFAPMFAMVRERSDHVRNLEEFYESGPMPLFMLARFSGSSIFEIWEAYRVRTDKYIKVSLGIDQEFILGRKAAGLGLVLVDPLAIYAWIRLGLTEMMLKFRAQFGVVQSSIDMLRQLYAERDDQRGQTFSSMSWNGEHYQMIEATPEYIEQRIADAKAAAEFADQLVLVAAESNRTLSPDVVSLIADAHPAFADTLLAGMRDQRSFLTDDLGLRAIAQECGIPCTWTQTFLQVHIRPGGISPVEYQLGLEALTTSRYDFTQLGHGDILDELRQSGWIINDKLRLFATMMVRPNVDRESLSTVLANLAIDSQIGVPVRRQLAAFHIAFVEALANVGANSSAKLIYQRVLAKLEFGYLKILIRREFKMKLLSSTHLTYPETLIGEFAERATALARGTIENLIEGGLRLPRA